jgi:hypothetical protein
LALGARIGKSRQVLVSQLLVSRPWRSGTRWKVAAAVVATSLLAACSGAAPETAVSVGSLTVSRQSVDHWIGAIAKGASPPNPSASPQAPVRRQALTFLIGAQWALAEASALGLRLPHAQLVARLRAREAGLPNGREEFRAELAALGESVADVELEIEVRWAMAEVRAHLMAMASRRAEQALSDSAVRRYYSSHLAHYSHAEHRFYDLIERIPSRARALALARRLGSGKRFARAAVKEAPLRSPRIFRLPQGEGAVLRAVFSARIGVLVGPLMLRGQYVLFVLRRIDPARVQPFSEVRESIARKLRARLQRRAYRELVAGYASRWRARTDCRPGYVTQKCRQYHGSTAVEDGSLGAA